MIDFEYARREMVEKQIVSRGVTDSRVLDAIRKVPREEFVDFHLREFAYQDNPLPIAEEQTISQPYIVALMTEKLDLKSDARVLEIGTGSGYAAAVLAELAKEVFSVERFQKLAETSRERLTRLGYTNVTVVHADGTRGLIEQAPFDAIAVAAAGPQVPDSLPRQLKLGGRLLIPVGEMETQKLLLVKRTGPDTFEESSLGRVRFVPLVSDDRPFYR